MRSCIKVFLLGVSVFVAASAMAAGSEAPVKKPLETTNTFGSKTKSNMVMSGHSLLDAAEETLKMLAEDNGVDLKTVYQTIPGSPIRARTRGSDLRTEHTWDGYAEGARSGVRMISEIRTPSKLPKGEKYDSLLITERHDLLGTIQFENTTSLLRHYHDVMLSGSKNVDTYFYHSWMGVKKNNPKPWIEYEKNALKVWECVASKVNLTLQADGLKPSVRTVPAGWAMARLLEEAIAGRIPGLDGPQRVVMDLIFKDDVHPTEAAGFFIGAYTYMDLFGKKPERVYFPMSMRRETGTALVDLAWRLAKEYHARKNVGVHSMASCREHVAENICEPFWTYLNNRKDIVGSCQAFYRNTKEQGNPFKWPDENRKVWRTP